MLALNALTTVLPQVRFLTEALLQKRLELQQAVVALGNMRQRNTTVG